MAQPIRILTTSMTGTADLVADEMALALADMGSDDVSVIAMDDLTPAIFEPGTLYIICAATYGQGDVPDNGREFYEALCETAPDLGAIEYTVVALGNSTYATFCDGGLAFDRILETLGARRLTPTLKLDASSGAMPEDEACAWLKGWVTAAIAPKRLRA